MVEKVLRLIGYWDDPHAPGGWPDVHDFLGPPDDPERRAVADYLRSGTSFVAAAGHSICRICGIANGSTELTDGEHFIWPEGLIHYVEAHDLRLPANVVTVARRGPAPPIDPDEFERAFATGELTCDVQWWQELPQPVHDTRAPGVT